MKTNRYTFIGLLVLSLCLLAGCVDADMHITVHADGSGVYRLKMLTNPLLTEKLQPIRKKAEAKGYQIRDLKKGNQTGWIAEKRVSNIADDPPARDLLEEISPGGKEAGLLPSLPDKKQGPLKVVNGFFNTSITFKENLNLKRLSTDDPLGKNLIDQMNLNLKLTLPLEPEAHNADNVSADGKTLTWNLKPGESNPVRVQMQVPNPVGWGILLLTLLIITVIAFWLIRRSRRRHVR
ncbi:DUF3153 domain-containing protein [Salinithrix halophila]|uniref:DUF3153 domain-containing protein n=1 Tax=Salinithrix halophila TaxID=1485204 RepID=A0ABV8JF43_9BACL